MKVVRLAGESRKSWMRRKEWARLERAQLHERETAFVVARRERSRRLWELGEGLCRIRAISRDSQEYGRKTLRAKKFRPQGFRETLKHAEARVERQSENAMVHLCRTMDTWFIAQCFTVADWEDAEGYYSIREGFRIDTNGRRVIDTMRAFYTEHEAQEACDYCTSMGGRFEVVSEEGTYYLPEISPIITIPSMRRIFASMGR